MLDVGPSGSPGMSALCGRWLVELVEGTGGFSCPTHSFHACLAFTVLVMTSRGVLEVE